MNELEIAARLCIAAATGLAIGFEREWSGHATGPEARFAGIRTFMMTGAVGGIAGWLSSTGDWPLAVVLIAAASAVAVAGYLAAARRNPADLDGTTEIAAVMALAIGVVAGRGHLALASGSAAVVLFALGEKAVFRRFIATVDEAEMRAALHFAVLALVVLPLLPAGPFGPYDAIRPRMIWTVVLILSGVNFAGYLARQAFGAARGHLLTGALGGLVSSTAVTLANARQSRAEPTHSAPLAAGTIAACTVLLPRVAAVSTAVNPAFGPRAALWLLGMFLAGAAVTLFAASRSRGDVPEQPPAQAANPLQLGAAIQMALAFQAVMIALEAARAWFGEIGVFATAGLAGLTDMDALTLSMSRLSRDPGMMDTAAAALVIGVIANTLLKGTVAAVLGGSGYRRKVVPALAAMGVVGVVTLLVLRNT